MVPQTRGVISVGELIGFEAILCNHIAWRVTARRLYDTNMDLHLNLGSRTSSEHTDSVHDFRGRGQHLFQDYRRDPIGPPGRARCSLKPQRMCQDLQIDRTCGSVLLTARVIVVTSLGRSRSWPACHLCLHISNANGGQPEPRCPPAMALPPHARLTGPMLP